MELLENIIHGNEGLPVAIYDVSPNHIRYEMKAHLHPEHEILYVRKGRFNLRLNQKLYNLKAGDVVFYSGGTIHTGIPEDCVYTCVLLNLPMLLNKSGICMDFASKLQSGEIAVEPMLGDKSMRFADLCEDMRRIFAERQEGYAFDISSSILAFFGEIMNKYLYSTVNQTPISRINNDRMKSVIKYIEENYTSQLRLEKLAEMAHMTPAHLCRCFKSVTGESPISFMIDYRLSQARYSLINTEFNVTDIAMSCGFNNISYFTKLFRKKYGFAPKQYKKHLPENDL